MGRLKGMVYKSSDETNGDFLPYLALDCFDTCSGIKRSMRFNPEQGPGEV